MTFLGLIAANLARRLLGTDRHRLVVPAAAMVGVLCTVGGQLLAGRVFGHAMPLAVIINLVGGTYFLYLLTRAVRE